MRKADSGRVVLIEDDAELVSYLKVKLSLMGFQVNHSDNVMGGLVLVRESSPAVVIANADLPHSQDVVTRLRGTGVPLLLLIGAASKCASWPAGVEVIVKPFVFHTLLGHLGSLGKFKGNLRVGEVYLDVSTRVVTVSDVRVPVTPTEFELLRLLMRHPNRAFSSKELQGALWPHKEVTSNALTVLAGSVRRKLTCAGQEQFIRTVRGYGYGLDTHAGPP
ncbi:response regulator transcription factor (plasmid) [Deinococcus radiomollis]|uniref:response regulator transcription factor n=1 Tax=Deinococcus radiomollis TaxID=468916 RepID=UPI0038917395